MFCPQALSEKPWYEERMFDKNHLCILAFFYVSMFIFYTNNYVYCHCPGFSNYVFSPIPAVVSKVSVIRGSSIAVMLSASYSSVLSQLALLLCSMLFVHIPEQ
jgi:hypothetical protein